MAEQQTINVTNGVDMDVLLKTINAVQEEPTLAKSNFRVHNKWVSGGQNQTTVTDFYGAGQDNLHKQTFILDADEPALLAGEDHAANPVEHLLHALAACLTTSMVYHAAVRGIEIHELESRLEGDLDIRGFMGLSQDVRKGYQSIRVTFKVKTAPENIEKLKALAEFSPVLDVVSNGTPVDIQVESK
jgi:uncharacterized OsmC-like protein